MTIRTITNRSSAPAEPSNPERGATIVEVLVAIVLLFIALTVALRLQISLADNLGTRKLDRAVTLADSLMVDVLSNPSVIDTTYTTEIPNSKLKGSVVVTSDSHSRAIRVKVHRGEADEPIHALYYEEEIPDSAS